MLPLRGMQGTSGLPACSVFVSVSDLARVLLLVGAKEEFAALRNFVLGGDWSRRGALLFPEICTMELHLLAAGSPDLEVLNHVFHSLLGAVHANQHNAALLYDQVRGTDSDVSSQKLCSELF